MTSDYVALLYHLVLNSLLNGSELFLFINVVP